MTEYPKISFIIPTLNAGGIIERCLIAIRSQNYPQNRIEIVVADGGSIDDTKKICKRYGAKIIPNPEILHEPGKARASNVATGEILFFTDADNILTSKDWVKAMVKPYQEVKNISGFLPETIPDQTDNLLNIYLSYLSTDPFTWFVYQWAATPRTYGSRYKPQIKAPGYKIYSFEVMNHPLLGLSQGFGTSSAFKREKMGHSDDILAGIKLISEGGLIAHVPNAGVFHYHVRGWSDFWKKYKWRIRNNFYQKVKGMGLVNRQRYLNFGRMIRQVMFVPYSFSLIFPLFDGVRLSLFYKNKAMLLHPLACLIESTLILKETISYLFKINPEPGVYGK